MELDKIIKERRTVKEFFEKPVSWNLIVKCLDAARFAPNSGNIQNFRFVIVREKEVINKIGKLCEGQEWISKAPVLIVVCSDIKQLIRLYGARGEALYAIQNCAVASENLILTAQSLGLGTSWIGAFNEDAIKELLEIPENIRPQAVIAIGYSKKTDETKRESLDNFVYFEKYGKREDKNKGIFPIADKIKSQAENFKNRFK